MLERVRSRAGYWALFCMAAFAVTTLAVVTGWGPLADLDSRGEPLSNRVTDLGWAEDLLFVIEAAFGTIGITILALVLAGAMWQRGHRRASVFALIVVAAASVAATAIKALTGRERPGWQPEDVLTSNAFPSTHATTTTALTGAAIVLVLMLVRRGGLRRVLYALLVATAVIVCADRVLLGRHFISDVVGGAALGAGIVLITLVLYTPIPRSHAAKAPPLKTAVPTQRRLAVVLNPIKVEDESEFADTVSRLALESGWSEPVWHHTTAEDSGTGQARAAKEDGVDLVLVCGGDGTVREVCAELAGTGIPVGIVPAGTGNLLARNLELPLYIRAAIDVALTGQDRAIDLVAVSGDGIDDSTFMVMAGMGFDAAIMEGVNDSIKAKVGWLAYVLSALKALMFPVAKVDISVDGGEPTTHRARTIVVGNVGYLQAGMPLLPNAAIDDGVLDVVVLHPRKFLSWIPLALRVLTKWQRTDDTINRMTGRTVTIRAHSDIPRQLDGDSIGPGRELRMECIHGRLLVRVPR